MSETDYEQLPEEKTGKDKLKTGVRFTRFLLLLCAAVFALIVLFVNRDKLNADNLRRLAAKVDIGLSTSQSKDETVIDYDYSSSSVVGVYKDGIARVTNESLVIMDNAGTQFQSVLTGFNDPALVTTPRYVMTYDRGGRRLIITNSFTVVFDRTFEDNIITAAMNGNGWFAVVTESDAYKNKLIVFNSSFKEVYRLNSMSRYLLSVDLTDDNKYAIASAYYVKGSDVIPQVCCFKFTAEEAVWSTDFSDDVAVDVACKSDGCTAALFQWGVCVLDSKGRERSRFEFESKIPQTYRLGADKYNVAVLANSQNGNSEVTVFESSGKKNSQITPEAQVISADVCGDRVALLTREKLLVYTASGALIAERENKNDASRILFSDKNSVIVISGSDIIYNIIS